MTLAEIDALIATAVAGPKKAQVDGRSAESHSLKELWEMRQAIAAQELAADSIGVKFFNTSPPGAV